MSQPERRRIGKDEYYMSIAHAVSKRGTCPRLQVGCAVVVNDSVVSTGYNGAPRKTRECDHTNPEDDMENGHCARAVHAEANAIVNAARNGASVLGGVLYVTATPCFRPCAPLITNAGIRRVVYDSPYRHDVRTFEMFAAAGIELLNINGKWTNEN